MSCAIAFAADSRVDFAELDVTLQESVLDELDHLCESSVPFPARTFIRDFTQDQADARHCLFLRLAYDADINTLLVLGIPITPAVPAERKRVAVS
ncbi:MAG TPA: hypothetical protein VK797_00845 [Tepidisphaeraceae bacterium]|jgi:hypothetical protein|nr:hypothetical protein [Tepidisphaeraceae bacterium]